MPFKSPFMQRPHRNVSFHSGNCDFCNFITCLLFSKVGILGHCLINTNWILCFNSSSTKVPHSEKVFFKICIKSSPLRTLESCRYTRMFLFPLGPLTFVFCIGGHRVYRKRVPGLEIVQAELSIHRKKLHRGFGFGQRRHEGIVSITDSGLTDHVGQDIVRVVLLFLQQLI